MLRDSFLGWQCRIRQMAVRQHAGYPLPGMKPRATHEDGSEMAGPITMVLLRSEPQESTSTFRHIVRRTQDPLERHEAAVRVLAAAYYQHAREFSDTLTALFSINSSTATTLLAAAKCVLVFEQFKQIYRIPCTVSDLERDDPAWQATYWHNHMFNPALPAAVRVLAFTPDWNAAEADPWPGPGGASEPGN